MKSTAFARVICLVVLLSVGNEGYSPLHHAVTRSHLKPAVTSSSTRPQTRPQNALVLASSVSATEMPPSEAKDERTLPALPDVQLRNAIVSLEKSADTLLDTFSDEKSMFVLINLLMMAPVGKVLSAYQSIQLHNVQVMKWLAVSFIAAGYLTRDKNRWYHHIVYAMRMRSMRAANNFRTGAMDLLLAVPLFVISCMAFLGHSLLSLVKTVQRDSARPLAIAADASSEAVVNVVAPLLSTADSASKEFGKVSEPMKAKVSNELEKATLVVTFKRKVGAFGQFWADNLKDLRQYLKAAYVRYTYVLKAFYATMLRRASTEVSTGIDKVSDGVADVALDTIGGVQKAERNVERMFETKTYYAVRGAVVDTKKSLKDVKDKTSYELNVLKSRTAAAATKSAPLGKKIAEGAAKGAQDVRAIPGSVSDGIAGAVVGLTTAVGDASPGVVRAEQELIGKTSEMLEKTSKGLEKTSKGLEKSSKEFQSKTSQGIRDLEKQTAIGMQSTSEAFSTIFQATEEFIEENVKLGAKEVPGRIGQLSKKEKEFESRTSQGLKSTSETLGTIFQATEEFVGDGLKRGIEQGAKPVREAVPKAQMMSKRVSYFSSFYITRAMAKFANALKTNVETGARSVAKLGAQLGFAMAAAAISVIDYVFEIIFTLEFKRVAKNRPSEERTSAMRKLYVQKRAADVYTSLYSMFPQSERLQSGFDSYLDSSGKQKGDSKDSDIYGEQIIEDIEGIQVSEPKTLTSKHQLVVRRMTDIAYDDQAFAESRPNLLAQILIAGRTKPRLELFEYLGIPRYGAGVTLEGYDLKSSVAPDNLPAFSNGVFAVANEDYTSLADSLVELGIIPDEKKCKRQAISMLNMALGGKAIDIQAYDAELKSLRSFSKVPNCFYILREALYLTDDHLSERAEVIQTMIAKKASGSATVKPVAVKPVAVKPVAVKPAASPAPTKRAAKPIVELARQEEDTPEAAVGVDETDLVSESADPIKMVDASAVSKKGTSVEIEAEISVTSENVSVTVEGKDGENIVDPVTPPVSTETIPDGLFRPANTTSEPDVDVKPTEPLVPDDLGLTRESVPSNIPNDPRRSQFMPRVSASSRLYQASEESPEAVDDLVEDEIDEEALLAEAEAEAEALQYSATAAQEIEEKMIDSEFLAKQLASIFEVLPSLTEKINEFDNAALSQDSNVGASNSDPPTQSIDDNSAVDAEVVALPTEPKSNPFEAVALRSRVNQEYNEEKEREEIKRKMRDALEARKQVQGLVQSSWSNFMYMNSIPRDSNFTTIAKYLLAESTASTSLREMLVEESAAAVDLLFRQATRKSFNRIANRMPKPPGILGGFFPQEIKVPFPVPKSLKKFNIRAKMMAPKEALEIIAPELTSAEEEYAFMLTKLASQTMGDDFGNVVNGDMLLNPMAAMKVFLSVLATGKVPALEDPAIAGSSQRLLDVIGSEVEASKASKDFNERLDQLLNSESRFTDEENEILAASANKLLERIRAKLADRLKDKLDIEE